MTMRREEKKGMPSMKHLTLRLAIKAMLSVLAVTTPTLSAQQPEPQTVKVPVTVVREADGKAVTGLKMDDFAIQEDGVQQKISSVELANDQYVVSYVPAPNSKAGYRRIEVIVDMPGLIVRARAGYWSAMR